MKMTRAQRMRRTGRALAPVLAVVLVAESAEFHVAPGGDAGEGTAERPFRTLTQARDAVRELRAGEGAPDGETTVWLHGGVYELSGPVVFEKEASGTEAAPVVIRAVQDEEVRIMGGRVVPPEAFQPTTDDEVLRRLDERARGNVQQAALSRLGVDKVSEPPAAFRGGVLPELFFEGRRMQLARWPDTGWVTIEKVVDRGWVKGKDDGEVRGGTFVYSGARPARWSVENGVWLQGYWSWDWYEETIKVAAIDTESRQIALAAPHVYGIGSYVVWNTAPRRYYAMNLLEELDQPGEWYLDTDAMILYFWPPADIADGEVVVSLLESPLITLKEVSYTTLRGIVFEGTRGTAVSVQGGARNTIAGCTFRNLGGSAVGIGGGERHLVVSCDIYEVGRGGISLNAGDRRTLTPAGHAAGNNHIHHYARLQRTYAPAIHLLGVGNRAENTTSSTMPPISAWSSWETITSSR